MESRQLMNLPGVEEEESISTQHDQYYDEDAIRNWADLPSEIHGLIFSRLLYFDRMRFRLTCKAWQSAANISHDSSSSSTRQDSPWLMFCSKPQSEGVYSFFNPISNETCTTKIPELAGAMVRCQRFGWLLMMRANMKSLFFYNPFIPGSTIEIPDFIYVQIASIYFIAPPTSSDCVVFACDVSVEDRVGIHKWEFGEDHWTDYNIDCQATFKTSACPPVFYNDVYYQLDVNCRLGVLNPNNKKILQDQEEFTLNDLPQPIARNDFDLKRMKNYIAGCEDGVLVSVFVGRKGDSIHVFELNWSRMEWVTLQSLGNKAMFISELGSLLIETEGGGAENKIYFPRFLNKEGGEYRQGPATKRVGVYYCLKTCQYHASESSFSRGDDWIGTRGELNSTWIEPNLDFDAWLRFSEDLNDDVDDDDRCQCRCCRIADDDKSV